MRRVLGTTVWEAKTLLAEYPSVSVPMARLRGHGQLVDPDSELLMEGFVRSGLSFAVAALRLAQEPRPIKLAHHTHAPGTVVAAIHRGVPVIVLVRRPRDAVLSYVIKTPEVSIRGALRGYIRFHRPLVPHLGRFVVGTFEEVTSDFGTVIGRANAAYGISLDLFEPSAENVERCLGEIEEDWRTRGRDEEERERGIPRPSPMRQRLKDGARDEYGDPRLASLRTEAERLFDLFAAARGARTPTSDKRDRPVA